MSVHWSERKPTRKCECGEYIHEEIEGDKCACCINMPDKIARKYAEEIADHYQTWGSPTFITYSILEEFRKEFLTTKNGYLGRLNQEFKEYDPDGKKAFELAKKFKKEVKNEKT